MSNMSRCQWCGKDFDPQHAIEAYRPEGERYGPVCSDQCLAQAGCISREKKERLEREAATRRSSEEARRFLQQEKYEEAIAAADKIAALDGKCVEAKVIKGLALTKKGRYELAVAELEEALKLDAGHAEAKEALEALFADSEQVIGYARAKYEERAYDAVAVLTGKLIERSPSRFDAYLLRGKAYRQSKKCREAIQDFTEALKCPSEEERKEALRERGACHLDLKDYQAAVEDCSAALQIDGQDAAALLIRGKSYLARKEYALAALDFYESARLDPAVRGDAAKGIEECEKHLTATLLAEVAEQPGARLTGGQRHGLGRIIEIYKLKETVAEIEKTKKRPTSPVLIVLLLLGLASLVSCFGLFAAPFRYEWYGPFLFLNLTWVTFAAWEFFRFRGQQRLDRTVNAPLVEEIERRSLTIKEHEASFGLDRAPKKDANHAPGIVVAGVVVLALSTFWLVFINTQQWARATCSEADQLWASGKKAEAVEKYQSIIDSAFGLAVSDARSQIVERVVEFDLERKDVGAAKAVLGKASGHISSDMRARLELAVRDVEDDLAVEEGHRLWEAGNAKKAVALYHNSAFRQWEKNPGFRQADKALIYSRLIDFNVKQGTAGVSIRKLIAQGLEEGLQLKLAPESVPVLKEAEADRKYAAFQAVVGKLKQFPDKLASDTERRQFNAEVEALLKTFDKLPLDVSGSPYAREKAKAIVTEYDRDVQGRYSGQLVNEFGATVAAIAVKLME